MANKYLATYLKDHLAGSVVAIELLEYVASTFPGSGIETLAIELRDEVVADRAELERLMEQLQVSPSSPRKAVAWVGEKLTQIKMRLEDPAGGSLRLLEAADGIAIGIDGKRALWQALQAASQHVRELRTLDYDRLIRRAEDQRARLEAARLEAATLALAGPVAI